MAVNLEEDYSKESLFMKISNGLVDADTAVRLKMDGKEKEMKIYLTGAKEILDYLANPESPINKKYHGILIEYGDIIQKARETFPEEESMNHIQKLLEIFR
jgi:hypothetical protein